MEGIRDRIYPTKVGTILKRVWQRLWTNLSSLTMVSFFEYKSMGPQYIYHINWPLYMDAIFSHSMCCKGVQWINSPHNGQSIEEVCNQMENERGKGRHKENEYHDKMIYKWFVTYVLLDIYVHY